MESAPPARPSAAAGGSASPGFQSESSGQTEYQPQAVARADDAVAVREEAPLQYVVKKGDTLWDIAGRFLIEPWQWPEVWIVNGQVKNPHLIYPGDVLTLIWRNGRPQVALEPSQDRMSPRVRESDLGAAIPTIPIEAIRDFLRGPRLVDPAELDRAPYLLDFVDLHIIGAAGNGAYAKRLRKGLTAYEVVRIGERYVDPQSRELLGLEAIPVAQASVYEFGDPGTVTLTRSFREANLGDYLVKPQADNFDANFYPRAPKNKIDSRIIAVFDGVSQIGQYQVVTLSKGSRDGVEVGHVLDILQVGRKARDPHGHRNVLLPETYAGQVMVFKTEQKVSFALVMSAIRAVHKLDRATNPGTRPVLN
ncbi:MAG TPA: LysM domain-containing protein [Solimonas sp.]|nr:LysM domain-containing protein [Solimonas sp.]